MSATALLEANPRPSEDEARTAIQGNICRCTGYQNIVEAITCGERDEHHRDHDAGRDRADGAAEGLDRHLDPAEGGQPARPGAGRLLRRHPPARHGLRPLRPLAVRPREDRLDRRLGGARARRGLRDADRRRGRDPHRSVLRDVDAAGRAHQGLRARRRARRASWASRSPRSPPRPASSRATRPSWSRSSTSRSTCSSTRARRSRTRRCMHEEAGSNVVWSGVFDWGDWEAAKAEADHVVTIDELHFHRFSSTPLECSGALVEYERGTGQWTLYCNHQMPGIGAIWMAPALRAPLDKLRFVTHDIGGAFGNKICLHPYYVVALPAGAEARPADPVDGVAHRPAHGERARQRALVPRRRGRGQGGRDDARLQRQGARRLRRVPALRAARLHHLGAGDARLLRLAEHPRRVHAGDDEQVAGLAEPRLLADAASLADRADHRHRRLRARARSGRGPQAELRQGRADAVRDAERLRLRLRRLRALPRPRARADRLRGDRGAAGGGGDRAASCSVSGSARRSTRGRTTSASRSS